MFISMPPMRGPWPYLDHRATPVIADLLERKIFVVTESPESYQPSFENVLYNKNICWSEFAMDRFWMILQGAARVNYIIYII